MIVLTAIVCYITDISGFSDTIKKLAWRWIFHGHDKPYRDFDWEDIHPLLKILSCSTCQTLWSNLILILILHQFTPLYIALSFLCSYLAIHITGALRFIKEAMIKVETLLYKLID